MSVKKPVQTLVNTQILRCGTKNQSWYEKQKVLVGPGGLISASVFYGPTSARKNVWLFTFPLDECHLQPLHSLPNQKHHEELLKCASVETALTQRALKLYAPCQIYQADGVLTNFGRLKVTAASIKFKAERPKLQIKFVALVFQGVDAAGVFCPALLYLMHERWRRAKKRV